MGCYAIGIFSERCEDLVNECGIEYFAIIQSTRIQIDPRRFLVIIDEEEYELYPKEFDVLYYLA